MTSSVLTAHDRAASPAPSSPSRSTWREAASALQPVPRRGPPPLRRGPDFEGNAPTTDGFPAYRAETPSGASPKSTVAAWPASAAVAIPARSAPPTATIATFLTSRVSVAMRTWSTPSAEAVRAREALREEADEQRRRQADDVQVVALDLLDEGGAAALDRIPAGASLPLAVRQVVGELTRRELPEGDARGVVLDDLPARREQAEARDDDMRLACELLEHLLRLLGARGLAVDPAAERDRGVDAQHRTVACLRSDRARLPERVLADELDRVRFRRV